MPCAPRAKRHPKLVRAWSLTIVGVAVAFVVVVLATVGVPPVRAVDVACVAVFISVGLVLSIGFGLASRQPLANIISMVLETNVRDAAMANQIIFVAFAATPFAFRYEAAGVIALFGTNCNNHVGRVTHR